MLLPVSFHGFFLRAFFFKGFFQGIQAKGKGIGKIFDVYPSPYLQQRTLKRKSKAKAYSMLLRDTTREGGLVVFYAFWFGIPST